MMSSTCARWMRFASRGLKFYGKRQYGISSNDDRWTGIPYKHFDVFISDINEKKLVEIGCDNRIKHPSIGSFPESPFPVKGRIHGMSLRLMAPLVCRYNGNDTAKPHNVWFLVDPAAPYTCLSAKSLETLVGKQEFVRHLHSFSIQVPSTNIECYLSKDHFSEVNLLGMNTMRRLRLSIDINWDTETFELIQK